MSRGLHCFVSASVLFTFDVVKLSGAAVWPGSPQRHVAVVDGKTLPVTSYPAAGLFLKTLKAACDRLVVVAPWDPERTAALLRQFGWDSFDETRTIYSVPGQDTLSLTSVGCSLDDLSSSIVITESKASWDPMLHAQIIEAVHDKSSPQSSLALLRVLSAFIHIAEARVRFPQTAVPLCTTLCRSGLFAHCRFCLSPELEDPLPMAMLIAKHGGYIVLSQASATHYVIDDELTLLKSKSLLQDITSDPSATSGIVNGSGTDMQREENHLEFGADRHEDDEDEESVEEDVFFDDVNFEGTNNKHVPDGRAGVIAEGMNWEGNRNTNDVEDDEDANVLSRDTRDLNNAVPITVTTHWIRDCCEGIQLYPPHFACVSDGDGSQWTTALLLAALLPPTDAEPLRLSNFNAIASANGFQPLSLSQMDDLQQLWGASLCMEADGESEDWLFSRDEKGLLGGGTEFARHLEFVAEQFCDAWEVVMRSRRRLGTSDAGTQTAVTVTASTATHTDAVERPAEPTGRALLMRALGPADWAREIGAGGATGASAQLRAAERTEAVDAAAPSEAVAVRDAIPPPPPPAFGDAEGVGEAKPKTPSSSLHDNYMNEEGGPDFTKCFISTELLGERSEVLERDLLLRQHPFRNYPMKVAIEKRGIHCVFASPVDAKRFYRERSAEILDILLPIVPEYDEDRSSAPDTRKRRRSRSPPAPKQSGGNSFQTKTNRREMTVAPQKAANEGWELSKSDLDLLNEIGANFEFALQNVHVMEHYAANELKDPAFRKQKQQLLNVIEKLKRIRTNPG